jgi:hypothetical protein
MMAGRYQQGMETARRVMERVGVKLPRSRVALMVRALLSRGRLRRSRLGQWPCYMCLITPLTTQA